MRPYDRDVKFALIKGLIISYLDCSDQEGEPQPPQSLRSTKTSDLFAAEGPRPGWREPAS
jgi:hypothetical protein